MVNYVDCALNAPVYLTTEARELTSEVVFRGFSPEDQEEMCCHIYAEAGQ
jgi:hypothetical protein